MSWSVPVVLERASDLSGDACAIILSLSFLVALIVGVLSFVPVYGTVIQEYGFPIAGILMALCPAPILLYYVVLIVYYACLAADWVRFESYHLSLRIYHRVYIGYLRFSTSFREARDRRLDSLTQAGHGWVASLLSIALLSRFTGRYLIRPRRRQWQTAQLLPATQEQLKPDPSAEDMLDHCMPSRVCKSCARVLGRSRLLLGSRLLVVRRQEKHGLEMTLSDLKASSERQFCHLCTTLWNSMSLDEQEAAKTLEKQQVASRSTEDLEQQPLLNHTGSTLYLMIQEKPGTPSGLSMQLSLEDVAIGPLIRIEESDTGPVEVRLGRTTKSAQCVSLAKEWLSGCKGAHQHCTDSANAAFLPSRLLHVEPSGPSAPLRVRLVETNDLPDTPAYLALSHCWGSTMQLTLTSHNKAMLLQNINLEDLSRNFQDAAQFSRMMGYSYIWIDSLCIIQRCFQHELGSPCNSLSKADWEHESKQMANVYASAECTISACGSADSSGGCFRSRNPLVYFPCHILTEKQAGATGQRGLAVRARRDEFWANTFQTQVDQSPLSGRAWAFQERMLSRRMIHFGTSMIFFECATLFASEQQPTGIYDGKDILAADGSRHKYPDLRRWSDMLTPFLPPPLPEARHVPWEPLPEMVPDPPKPPPAPKARGNIVGKHERQSRNAHRRRVREHGDRILARLDEYDAAMKAHMTRHAVREAAAKQLHEIAVAKAAAAPPVANPAYVAPDLIASLADNSVTGYRGAFEFLRATAATASQVPATELRDQLRLHQRWFELVAKYTRCALTVLADRPAAIAGVVTAIQGGDDDNDERLAANEYFAGLWRRHFIFDLLWSAEHDGKPRTQRPQDYRAPSWSWMSIDRPVSQQLLPFTLANEARECDINLLADARDICLLDEDQDRVTDSTTAICDGWLDIYCPICPVLGADVTGPDDSISLSFSTTVRCNPDLPLQETDFSLGKVFCLPILTIHRKPLGPGSAATGEVQAFSMHGIVARRLPDRQGHEVYERIGTFVVEAMDSLHMKRVSKGIIEASGCTSRTVRIV